MHYEWVSGDVVVADGVEVARAHRAWVRERAEVTVGGEPWTFGAEGSDRVAISGWPQQVRIRARRRSWWRTSYDVECAGATYTVQRAGFLGTSLVVLRSGVVVGRLTKAGWWTDRPALDLDVEVAPVEAVFLMWLGYLVNRRNSSAAASSTT